MWLAEDRALGEWMEGEREKIKLPNDARTRASATCLMIAMGHHKAITLLMAANMGLAAFTLLRAQHESFVRGLWLMHIGSEAEVEKFLNAAFKSSKLIKTEKMVQQLAPKLGKLAVDIKNFHAEAWSVLSEIAHGRGHAAHVWQHPDRLEVVIPSQGLAEWKYVSTVRALMAGWHLALQAGNSHVADAHSQMLESTRKAAVERGIVPSGEQPTSDSA